MNDDDFFSTTLNSYEPHACSPGLTQGGPEEISIAAPGRLDLATRRMFPLCGALRLSARAMATMGQDPIEATVVVVVDSHHNVPLSFNLTPDKEPLCDSEDQPAKNPEEFDEHDLRVNHFNVDLLTFSEALRRRLRPGRYVIYAVLGTHKSNTVQVEVHDSLTGAP